MLPQATEYLFLLTVFAAVGISLLWHEVGSIIQEKAFWFGVIVFSIYCLLIEIIAISKGWWAFNEAKTLGVAIKGVPIEEFALFPLFYILVISAWRKIKNDPG